MENSREANVPNIDPRADLELLERSKASVAVNDLLDFGPWWYAPMLATCVGGLTLFGQDFGVAINIAYGVAGFGAGIFMATHDYRRRTVRPKSSARSFWLLVAIVATTWIVIGLWGTAVSSIGYDSFVPVPALIAWVLTTCGFLAIRQVCHSVLARRQALVA